MNKQKNRASEAIKLQTEIVNATSKLYELGYRIETTYIEGAGWASEIVDYNTGENNQLDEQEIIDAEQDKNKDYALDNMTCDDYDNAETWEELDKFDNSEVEDK